MKRIVSLAMFCAIIFAMVMPVSANAATVGTAYTTPDPGWTRIDDQDNRIHYGGTGWTSRTDDSNGEYKGSIHFSPNMDASISFKFSGSTGLRIITSSNSQNAVAAPLFIDGSQVATLKYNPGTTYNVNPLVFGPYQDLLYSNSSLSNSVHTVTIYAQSGFYINLDALEVYGGALVSDVTAPTEPSSLNAVPSNGSTALTWGASTDSDDTDISYNVFVDGVKKNTSAIKETTYTVTGLSNNTTHTYYVVAYDPIGNASSASNTVTTNFDTISPITPVDLAVNGQTNDSVTLTWTPNAESDLAGYNIYMNDAFLDVGTVTGNTYTVTGLSNSTKYSFQITAIDTSGNESPKSNIATGTTASIDRAILTITLDNGLEKEFDLSMDEVNAFTAWYEAKAAGTGPASYAIDKHDNNKGPFKSRKDYVIFDKILTYEVDEYSPTN